MSAKHVVELTPQQQTQLLEISSKGRNSVRKLKRAQTLLLSDEGYKDEEIAQRLDLSIATVGRTRRRFVAAGMELALSERPRRGRSRKLDAKAEAFLIATACSDAPDGQAHWSMQLLADRLVQLELVERISDETVRRRLKKVNLSLG